MGVIMSAAGAAIMVIGVVLFILQARRINKQAKKEAKSEQAFTDKELGSTAPLTVGSDVRDEEPLGDTVGFDK